jgi:hypothetical protein
MIGTVGLLLTLKTNAKKLVSLHSTVVHRHSVAYALPEAAGQSIHHTSISFSELASALSHVLLEHRHHRAFAILFRDLQGITARLSDRL